MNLKFNRYFGIAAAFSLLTLGACQETEYMKYESDYTGIYFTRDTLSYSFSVTPVEVKTHVFNIPVQIMGAPAPVDRDFAFELIADSCKGEEGVQYRIGRPVVAADSIHGVIPVEILRDGLKGSYADGYTRYQLAFRLLENDNFYPTLSQNEQIRIFKFDNAVEMPDWKNAFGEKVWPKSMFGTWHPYTFIKIVEYFHAYEQINPETYKKMVVLYGENLEHIPYGDPYQYRTVFKKYICDPVYKYTNDERNKAEIIEAYPDYPFDFPNPFAN